MEVKIYVLFHRAAYVPAHPLLLPLQIGAALRDPLPGMLQDQAGENISARNPRYCELTGQYWAWKNETADYFGFFHYRRYLAFRPDPLPYRILDLPDARTLARLGYAPQDLRNWIARYDAIVPMPEELHETVWENWRRAPYHFAEDLQLAADLVRELYPAYEPALEAYWGGTRQYLKNMYILRGDLFDAYCAWLFPLLEAFDRRSDWGKYRGEPAALRVDGYLAERLFGVWYTELLRTRPVRAVEVPRVHFARVDGDRRLERMRPVNAILPPGTRRRHLVSRPARYLLRRRAERKLRSGRRGL